MTKTQNKRMQISLCKCNQAFRGSNLRIHLASSNVEKDIEAGIEHGLYLRKYFCARHKVFAEEGDEELKLFHSQHSSCVDDNLRLTKKEMKTIILNKEEEEEKEKKEKKEKEQEVDLDKSETALATDFLVQINKRSAEVDEDLSFPHLKKRRMYFESDSDNEESFKPQATSTPIEEEEKKAEEEEEKKKAEEEEERKKAEEEKKQTKEVLLEEKAESRRKEFEAKNSIRRQREWERENAVKITQERAFDDLNRRLANMRSARDVALNRLEALQAKTQMANRLEKQVADLLVEKKEWRVKEEKMKEEMTAEKKKRSEAEKKAEDARKKAEKMMQEAEKQAQEEKIKREREMNVNFDLRKELEAAKQRELALLERLEVLEEKSSSGGKGSIRFLGHLACVNGRIAKSYVEKEDLNKSILCYEDSANGVHCHHITIVQEDGCITSVKHRNVRRLSID